MPGQLFYSTHVPLEEADVAKSHIAAVMRVIAGRSVAKIDNNGTVISYQLYMGLATNEFMFVVPSEKELELLTKSREFKCKVIDMKVSMEKSDFMVG